MTDRITITNYGDYWTISVEKSSDDWEDEDRTYTVPDWESVKNILDRIITE